MDLIHGTSLLSTPGNFGPVVITHGLTKKSMYVLPYASKNDDEEYCFLK